MIPYGKHHIDDDDIQAVVRVLQGSMITQGPAIELFEKKVRDYVGVRFAVAVSSGSAALHLSALAADIQPGKSLVTSPITFVATANAGLHPGGDVIFADIDPETINMSPEALQNILSKNKSVRAIVPVHFAGLPCDMKNIKSLADEAEAVVIEDAAHALGATYDNGNKVGCCENSLMTIFSFHPVKAIAAGEGGMITTNDEVIYRKLLKLRSHGINKIDDPLLLPEAYDDSERNPWYYEMQELGFHYRITDIQSSLATSQLNKIDDFITRRRTLVMQYDKAFKGLKNCRPAQIMGKEQSGHHLYVLRIDFNSIGLTRGQFMRSLSASNIGSQVHYIPVPLHPYYQKLGHNLNSFKNAKEYYDQALSIPLFYDLTDDEQNYVIKTIKALLG